MLLVKPYILSVRQPMLNSGSFRACFFIYISQHKKPGKDNWNEQIHIIQSQIP